MIAIGLALACVALVRLATLHANGRLSNYQIGELAVIGLAVAVATLLLLRGLRRFGVRLGRQR